MIIFANIPLVVSAVIECIKNKRANLLYAIPVYIIVASLSVFVIYKENKEVVTTVENTAVTTDLQDDLLVYVTYGGERYHKQDCPSIKNIDVSAITLRQAEENLKSKCKKCFD